MRARTLIILVILAVVAIGGGWYFGTAQEPAEQQSYNTGKPMFPDLAPKLKDAARIEIVHQGKTMAIVKHGDTWGLEDRGGGLFGNRQLLFKKNRWKDNFCPSYAKVISGIKHRVHFLD